MPRRFTIGRDRANDIAIVDDSVSRTHAEMWLEDNGTLMLSDQGSSNGTELTRGGATLPLIKTALLPGDSIRFGTVTLSLKELIDAIELKYPGALTRPPQAPQQPPSPPPRLPPPPLPPAIPKQGGPPLPPRAAAGPTNNPLVRCECGAIKTLGQICPGCNR